MGLNKVKAICAAKELNSILVRTTGLTTSILGVPTLKSHIEWMRKTILPERENAAATLEMYYIRFRQLERSLGKKAIGAISVEDLNDLREPMTPRPSNQIR
jgi:hypothetical protein